MLAGRPPPVLSREELEAEKQELAAIDARPIKKIAEAKARKKRRLAVRQSCAASCLLSKLLACLAAARRVDRHSEGCHVYTSMHRATVGPVKELVPQNPTSLAV